MLGLFATFGALNHVTATYHHLHAWSKILANNYVDRIIQLRWVCSMCGSLQQILGGGHSPSMIQFRCHEAPPTGRLIVLLELLLLVH